MNHFQLDGLLKGVLSAYREDFNKINPDDPIDFDLDFDATQIDAEQIDQSAREDFIEAFGTDPLGVYTYRIIRRSSSAWEAIFSAWRPMKDYPKKSAARHDLLKEAITHLMVGGIEYAHAIALMETDGIKADH